MFGRDGLVGRLARVFAGSEAEPVDAEGEAELARRVDARLARALAEHRVSPGPSRVAEPVSVVLRRQVPVRHDDAARSWIGGLPMMPENVAWPRAVNPERVAEGERPLHFVAQIACADLPAELWGGLGSREGWLLFFLNNNASTVEGKLHRVVHIAALGPERSPPADIGPVHDGMFTGSCFTSYMDQADVPPVWRRWPVDLVPFPNKVHGDGPGATATLPDFAATLYPDQLIATDDRPPLVTPFSWRCIRFGWDGLTRRPAPSDAIARNEAALLEKLAALGPPESILVRADAEEQRFAATDAGRMLAADPAEVPEDKRAWLAEVWTRRDERQASRERLKAVLAAHPTHDALRGFLIAEREQQHAWLAAAADRHVALASALTANDPDAPIGRGEWAAIRAALEADCSTAWVARHGRGSIVLEELTLTAWQLFEPRVFRASAEVAAACYTDQGRHRLVSDDALATLEPRWRTLSDNRPHRIGGFHDGVQSSPDEAARGQVLLLQLASDNAMQWCWGDAGAVYWWIPADALATGRFDEATCMLECH